jgi:hypothetical protein
MIATREIDGHVTVTGIDNVIGAGAPAARLAVLATISCLPARSPFTS